MPHEYLDIARVFIASVDVITRLIAIIRRR